MDQDQKDITGSTGNDDAAVLLHFPGTPGFRQKKKAASL
jgi:hypothetical protein